MRVRYPSRIPPGWGRPPWRVFLAGAVQSVVLGGALVVVAPAFLRAGRRLIRQQDGDQRLLTLGLKAAFFGFIVVVTVLLVRAIAMLMIGLLDVSRSETVEGQVLRLRRRTEQDNGVVTHIAVDDGTDDHVRAWIPATLSTRAAPGSLGPSGRLSPVGIRALPGAHVWRRLIGHPRVDCVPTLSSLKGMSRSTCGSFGQAEHPFADDVALHLVGAAGDARRGRREDAEGPPSVARRSSHAWPPAPAMAIAEVGRAPGEQRAGELGDRALRARRLARPSPRRGALPDVAHDLRADVDVGDALAHDRVVEHAAPAGELDERLHAGAVVRRRHRRRWRPARSSAWRWRSASRRRPRRSGSRRGCARR